MHDLVDARNVLVRAVLPEGGDAGQDNAWVLRLECFVVEAKALLDVGTKILDQDVGLLREPMQHCAALVALQIECNSAFVAVLVLEVGLMTTGEVLGIARAVDADDIRAPVGKLAHADRSGPGVRQIEDDQILQGGRCWLV